MDLWSNVKRLKDNIILISDKSIDNATKDKGYIDSFVYLVFYLAFNCVFLILFSLIPKILYLLPYVNRGESGWGALVAPGGWYELESYPILALAIMASIYALSVCASIFFRIAGSRGTQLQTLQVFIYGGLSPYAFYFPIMTLGQYYMFHLPHAFSFPGDNNLLGAALVLLTISTVGMSLINIAWGLTRVHKLSPFRTAAVFFSLILAAALIFIILAVFLIIMTILFGPRMGVGVTGRGG
jgi:hypothetical protein